MTPIKQRLWEASGRNLYRIVIAAANINQPFPDGDYEAILREVDRIREQPKEPEPEPQPEVIQHDWRARYQEAHRINFQREYPSAWKDGFYSPPAIPKITTSNGLTTYVLNYLKWMGYYSNRINTMGRKIKNKQGKEIWIPSSTKKGTGDTVACIKGRMIWFEIKVGKDTPSDKQLKQQQRVQQSGGGYYFIHTPDEFLTIFDSLVYG